MLIAKEDGFFLLALSDSRAVLAEAFMRNLEFDIFRTAKDTEITVDFGVFRSVLKSIWRVDAAAAVTIEYPFRDNKLLLLVEDDSSCAQFALDTYISEPQYNIELSGNIIAMVKFLDAKIIKQALEVACHKSDCEVFLTFSTQKPMVYFTKEDPFSGIKSKINVPFVEQVDCKVSKSCEKTYPAKVLKGIANFPKCRDIELKMHDEGILEIEVNVTPDALVRHFIKPLDS
jgi:hypothetical protein